MCLGYNLRHTHTEVCMHKQVDSHTFMPPLSAHTSGRLSLGYEAALLLMVESCATHTQTHTAQTGPH